MRGADRRLVQDALAGAVAGVAATWLMGRLTTFLYEREDPVARAREDALRQGRTAYAIAAERGAARLGLDLSEAQRDRVGTGLHWALGIGAGAAYALLRHRVPGADLGAGLLFGAVFFLLIDEGANTALGLTPPPRRFPWQAHARGLAGHLAFGAAAHAALAAADRAGSRA